MPRGDRRGPEGLGPMTGRRAGFCSGAGRPGYMNGGAGGYHHGSFGRGAGMGRNAGYGYGRRYNAYVPSEPMYESEKDFLEQEITTLKDQLKALEQRLSEKDSEA